MSDLLLKLPPDVAQIARRRVEELGMKDVEAYVATLIRNEGEAVPLDPDLEAELLAALVSMPIPADDAYWDAKRRRLESKHRPST
ncbi:MAG: hypothetical protein ACFCVE_05795 [Phycisphaerae bacterium]